MDTSMINTLLLVYNIDNRYEEAYVSEFFKMCGLLICEKDLENLTDEDAAEILMSEGNLFDKIVFFGFPRISGEYIPDEKCIWWDNIENLKKQYDDIREKNEISSSTKEGLIKDLKELSGAVFAEEQDVECVKDLAEIYVNSDYCYNCYLNRYFCATLAERTYAQVKDCFISVISEVEKNFKDCESEIRIPCRPLYVKYLCLRKINDLCQANNYNFYCVPGDMYKKCKRFSEVYSTMPRWKMLEAEFAGRESALEDLVVPSYERVIDCIPEEHPILAYIYYRMGIFCEKTYEYKELAETYYQRSEKSVPLYFRSLFKTAGYDIHNKKYEDAIRKYKTIINRMLVNRRKNMVFPVEYEYMAKCYILLGIIYGSFEDDFMKKHEYFSKAVYLVESEMEKSDFFAVFLRDSEILSVLRERIALRKHVLVEKYR